MTTVTEAQKEIMKSIKRIKEHDQQRRLSFPFSFSFKKNLLSPEPPSSRRSSIIKEPVELHEEHDDVNLDSLEAFLDELLDLYSYGIQLLKVLKQKYKKVPNAITQNKIKNMIDALEKFVEEDN